MWLVTRWTVKSCPPGGLVTEADREFCRGKRVRQPSTSSLVKRQKVGNSTALMVREVSSADTEAEPEKLRETCEAIQSKRTSASPAGVKKRPFEYEMRLSVAGTDSHLADSHLGATSLCTSPSPLASCAGGAAAARTRLVAATQHASSTIVGARHILF